MPIPFRDADLAFALKDAGVPVTLGASSTFGLVRKRGIEDLGQDGFGGIADFTVVVTVRTGTLVGLKSGAAITVNGESFIVKRPPAEDDGHITRLACVKQ